jgi:two-component system NtrC family response regulator
MGAYDFLAKPFEPELLNLTIERAFRLADCRPRTGACRRCTNPDALAG